MAIQRLALKAKYTLGFEELAWEDVRSRVRQVNPDLVRIIDEFEPSKEHTFILAKYPYGSYIRSDGVNYFPTETGTLASLDDSSMSNHLKSQLSYSTSPLGLVLDKCVEVFAESPGKERSIPFKIFGQGVTFGVWELMEFPQISLRQNWTWDISAGARSLFMLTSIGQVAAHERLQREFKLRSYVPDTIFDHHKIFKEIVHHSDTDWCTEVLFFTKKWLEPNDKNLGWIKLREYWARQAWWQIQYWANRVTLNLNWEQFIAELTRRKIKLNAYLLDTIKQLVSIGTGTITGFRPVDENEIVAPTSIIEDAYLDIYHLKRYAPMIMQPDFVLPDSDTKAVYYSLQYPTLPEKPPALKSFPSTMKMIRQLKSLMDIFLEMMDGYQPVNDAKLLDFNDHIKFDYFHNEEDRLGLIRPTGELIIEDPILKSCPDRFSKRPAPEGCHFFRGCVRISLE
ncbi:MAG: hypothetical protein CMF50_00910 [Legionellales bacterium]|nr:hypothetical protein [Legionellales bacterium]|tara:strand:- start:18688 stop:20046 length:1359 start_codon:yes stop_codon:yes gene_type:complete